jgi:hypothetical protein
MRALSLSFAGALLLSTSALANNPAWLERADANGDGFVSPVESSDYEARIFAEMDANRDGILTKGEWEGIGDFRFDYVDLNSDGVVRPEEARSAYISGYRYNGLVAGSAPLLTVSPSGTIVTYTASFPPAPYQQPPVTTTYTYVAPTPTPYVAVAPSVTYVAPAPAVTVGRRIPDEVYEVPQYVLQGYPNTQRIVEPSQPSGFGQGDPFALDGNRDGVLTIGEVLSYNDWNFQRHDVNADGWLDSYEWNLKAQEHFGHRVNPQVLGTLTNDTFSRHDRDGDGRVSKVEWDRQVEAEFTVLDSDGDRVLRSGDFQLVSR